MLLRVTYDALVDSIFDFITPKTISTALEMITNHPEYLIETTDSGMTPLHYAIEFGYQQIALAIIDMQPDLEVEGVDGYTALFYAATRGEVEILDRLIENSADVNHVDSRGWTPISSAFMAFDGDPAALRSLMAANADPTITNNYGKGIADFLVMPKNKDIADEVRQYFEGYEASPDSA